MMQLTNKADVTICSHRPTLMLMLLLLPAGEAIACLSLAVHATMKEMVPREPDLRPLLSATTLTTTLTMTATLRKLVGLASTRIECVAE